MRNPEAQHAPGRARPAPRPPAAQCGELFVWARAASCATCGAAAALQLGRVLLALDAQQLMHAPEFRPGIVGTLRSRPLAPGAPVRSMAPVSSARTSSGPASAA